MSRRSPIGIDDFEELVSKENDYSFVDKSRLIKTIIDTSSKVTLITRPRRWGKTLNLSMLEYFFSSPKKELFNNLAIEKLNNGRYMDYQGQYPVIFVSFKDIKQRSLASTIDRVHLLFQSLFRKQKTRLLNSRQLDKEEKALFNHYLTDQLTEVELENALLILSELLHKHSKKKVYILVDEYDTPINHAYVKSYFDEMTSFMKNLFSATLKGNIYLEKGIMTGILRVSKDSMLSGLNNVEVFSVLNDDVYAPYFGFTETEVKRLFNDAGVTCKDEISTYYNGYRINDCLLYNPWSIMECLKNKGKLQPYWVNTADDTMLKDILIQSAPETKQQLQKLINDDQKIINVMISEATRFEDIKKSGQPLWSFLLATGHLTPVTKKPLNLGYQCTVRIPNEEVRQLYAGIFQSWLLEQLKEENFFSFIDDLASARIEQFIEKLQHYLIVYGSFHDFTHESSYHTFLLGLLCSITPYYWLHSNVEAGLGRADLILIPKENDKHFGIIIELKRDKNSLSSETLALQALTQIDIKQYDNFLKQYQHLEKILKIGLAFNGKLVTSCYRWDDINGKPLDKLVMKSLDTDKN